MYAKSTEKREFILEGAKNVILKKGYSATSMKDIIEECDISRGGLYFYFSSVEEIFKEILNTRERTSGELIDRLIEENNDFSQLLDDYFSYQKERLLHMEKSLLSSVIEYAFTHKDENAKLMIDDQYQKTKQQIHRVLNAGTDMGALCSDIMTMTEHILFLIEGLSIKAITVGISPEKLDAQFRLLKEQLIEEKGVE